MVSQIPGVKTAAVGCNEDWQDSVDVAEVVVVRSTVALEAETKPSKLPSNTPSALAEWWWAGWPTAITCCRATVGCFTMTTTQLVCCTRRCLGQIRVYVDVIANKRSYRLLQLSCRWNDLLCMINIFCVYQEWLYFVGRWRRLTETLGADDVDLDVEFIRTQFHNYVLVRVDNG